MPDENLSQPLGPIAVLGGGSWGTALALLLADGGYTVRLWDRTPALADALTTDHENRRYLPGFPLPTSIYPTSDMATAVTDSSCVVVAVPSSGVRSTLTLAAPFLRPACDIVLAAKGMESETGLLPSEVALEILSHTSGHALLALSGPNLAGEVARRIPTAAVAAGTDPDAAQRVARLFNRPFFRVYTGSDRLGVEIGGAVKNVLAIAGGVSDGLGYGENTKAALLTRGLAEMTRFGTAKGAVPATFYGLAGVGDLMATAGSRLSRNWRVGDGLSKGETLEAILQRLGQVAEGVNTAQALTTEAARLGVEMPVCAMVAALLFEGLSPTAAVQSLMTRTQRDE
jgi:glycerol-3-phosphate dehydrogenase (NAD(P)+)